jgi:hypothetical protein
MEIKHMLKLKIINKKKIKNFLIELYDFHKYNVKEIRINNLRI